MLRGEPGKIFVLRSFDLGSLDVGSPVFYRRTRVGRVVGYTLDAERDELSVRVFIEAPYQQLVRPGHAVLECERHRSAPSMPAASPSTPRPWRRCWPAEWRSRPHRAPRRSPAPAERRFTLFSDRTAAMAPPDGLPVQVRMVFDSSVRGLTEGAAIDFLGIEIGRVTSIALQYDPARKRFPVEVFADVFPQRLGPVRAALLQTSPRRAAATSSSCSNSSPRAYAPSCAPATCSPGSSTWPSTSSARSRRARH